MEREKKGETEPVMAMWTTRACELLRPNKKMMKDTGFH